MTAVGRPESVRRRYRDHRIEEEACRPDGISKAGGVRFGEIALKWGGHDLLDGERREHQRLTGKGIAISADDGAPVPFHLSGQLRDVIRRRVDDALAGLGPTRRSRLPSAGRLPGCLPRLFLGGGHTERLRVQPAASGIPVIVVVPAPPPARGRLAVDPPFQMLHDVNAVNQAGDYSDHKAVSNTIVDIADKSTF